MPPGPGKLLHRAFFRAMHLHDIQSLIKSPALWFSKITVWSLLYMGGWGALIREKENSKDEQRKPKEHQQRTKLGVILMKDIVASEVFISIFILNFHWVPSVHHRAMRAIESFLTSLLCFTASSLCPSWISVSSSVQFSYTSHPFVMLHTEQIAAVH